MRLILDTAKENWAEVCQKSCEKTEDGEWRVLETKAGLDIPIPETVTIYPGQRGFKLHLGVKVSPNYHFWLVPRSSIVKTPLRMSNSIGIIDNSYRGELIFCVDNLTSRPYVLKKGRRICQIVSMLGSQICFTFGRIDQPDRGVGADSVVPKKVQLI